MRPIDADALKREITDSGEDCTIANYVRHVLRETLDNVPTIDAVPVVRCRDCRHKKLDGPSTCKGIVNEFYCDEKLEWRYQYEGEPDILDWFCADGEAKTNAAD